MSEVSELLMVSNGAITALVQKLEADGFIHREVDSEDRRTFRLQPVAGRRQGIRPDGAPA